MRTQYKSRNQRQGVAAVMICLLMIPVLFILAFSIDYGYLLFVETGLQRTADQAALAAVRDLTPDPDGDQDLDAVRACVREYVELNFGSEFSVADADIVIGRYERSSIYGDLNILSTGVFDTVRVVLRRDDVVNPSVSLYFARLFRKNMAEVIAESTAVLQPASMMGPGTRVLPIALEFKAWNKLDYGDQASVYGDGRITDDSGKEIPGNWGTLDIGPESNSLSELSDQIDNGLSQSDLDALHSDGRIGTNEYIDSSVDVDMNGDTGLSSGLKHSLAAAQGTTRVAPIYKGTSSHGGGLEFTVVGWASVKVLDSKFQGSKNSYVNVQKSYLYDENLRPASDLSNPGEIIEGAYTSPVLVK